MRTETAEEGESPITGRIAGGRQKNAFSAETRTTAEHPQAKEMKPKHARKAGSVHQIRPPGYELSFYLGCLAASAAFKKDSVLPLALRDDDLESRQSSFVVLLCSSRIAEKHRASGFFPVKEVRFLGELVWVCRTYQNAKVRVVGARDENSV